jgi:hypothetical protein
MPVREAHALRRELIEVRGRDPALLKVIALHIAITKVVSKDNEDIWLLSLWGRCRFSHAVQLHDRKKSRTQYVYFIH